MNKWEEYERRKKQILVQAESGADYEAQIRQLAKELKL